MSASCASSWAGQLVWLCSRLAGNTHISMFAECCQAAMLQECCRMQTKKGTPLGRLTTVLRTANSL
ncbi:hypothetical protein PR003_g19721 [Phytophthora rubi]|uniref:Uncharacterized protein n=1 Tax=Phytophthora rubi TaxID=129364 RepID=A0A6A3H043_9STRA|nr:hypothetical protein PR001_g29591 [Phytophthora rubi]KAE9003059.1 hypothetical protein PR002_g17446 [Phytophthora rubi]KAE9312604.1 hypothetical protein PR003_g19721 [Phytophthora rubi]